MSTSEESPSLIEYTCDRCKTHFVPPLSRRWLGFSGEFQVIATGVRRTLRDHEDFGAGCETARRKLRTLLDDEAYRSFVQSVCFCHECRQFVCLECWSSSRRSCLTCVARSIADVVRPRRRSARKGLAIPSPAVAGASLRPDRLRHDATLVALALAIFMLIVEGGVLLAASNIVAYR